MQSSHTDIGIMCTQGSEGNENGGFVSADDKVVHGAIQECC